MSKLTSTRLLAFAFAAVLPMLAACPDDSVAPPGVKSVGLTPDSVYLETGATQQFNVVATMDDNTTATVPGAVWTATGGTVSSTGLYTAGTTAGTFMVIAADSNGAHKDTAKVVIVTTRLLMTPDSVKLGPTATQQFSTVIQRSDATTRPSSGVTYIATGGTISTAGLYTAGANAGTAFTVIATDDAGRKDTSKVVIEISSAVEPVFTAATDTSLLGVRDGTFDGYASIAAVGAHYTTNGTLITPGRDGAGKAVRLTYTPAGVGVEVMQYLNLNWVRRNQVTVSFYFRTSLNADPTSGRFNQSGFKWLILRRDGNAGDPNGRITAGVSSLQQGFQYGSPDNGVQFTVNDQSVAAGGFFQNISKSIGWSVTNGQGATNRSVKVNDGNWHRFTIDADPFADRVQVWVDGTLIISSVGLSYAMFNQGWDEVGFGQNVVPDLLAGFGFTLDYDDLKVWTRGNPPAGAARKQNTGLPHR